MVYRPHQLVINDFTAFMGDCITKYNDILLLGDFNIHVCCPFKPLEMEFLSLIDSFSMVQWVKDSTHTHGHTLDFFSLSRFFYYYINMLRFLILCSQIICLYYRGVKLSSWRAAALQSFVPTHIPCSFQISLKDLISWIRCV